MIMIASTLVDPVVNVIYSSPRLSFAYIFASPYKWKTSTELCTMTVLVEI